MQSGPSGESVMRLVLDINIAVSGLLWSGPASRLIEAAAERRIEVFVTTRLLEQLRSVLAREKFRQRLLLKQTTIDRTAARFRAIVTVVEPFDIGAPVVRDRDDLAILECAVAANADMIVSGDDDLLVLQEFRNIPIVKPVDAARTLGYRV